MTLEDPNGAASIANRRSAAPQDFAAELERDGVTILPAVYSRAEVSHLLDVLDAAMLAQQRAVEIGGEAIRSSAGTVYAARNVLAWFPAARHVWNTPPLTTLLASVLGPRFGLVRALFFDKPPDRSWSLPWHKDLTIAVADNRLPSTQFSHPTVKAGVAHVEAPEWLLRRMLTLRIHLDDVTDENGPLKVIPGSHRGGKTAASSPLESGGAPAESRFALAESHAAPVESRAAPVESRAAPVEPRAVLVEAGGVLAMRPLISHASGLSTPGTTRHRRILHLEFAADPNLPDGYAWREFFPWP